MPASFKKQVSTAYKEKKAAVHAKKKAFLDRRPHRSFQLTRRRDYARSLQLPGYWSFTFGVNKTLWTYKKIFIGLAIIYAILSVLLIGFGSQDVYTALNEAISDSGFSLFTGDLEQFGQAGLLFASLAMTGLTGTLTEGQQIYGVIIFLLVWLTSVWLLRQLLAGHEVRIRDGLYNAGAPILPTFIIAAILVIQLIPIALVVLAYFAASATGLLAGGVEAMLFWIAAILVIALSLYWVTSTFIAFVIVTLPGTYPIQAMRIAGDMVVGRRVRILLRVLWMLFMVLIAWLLILVPAILIDGWLKDLWPAIEWLPIVPFALLVVNTLTVVWVSSYIYLLYRKVVEDDALPA